MMLLELSGMCTGVLFTTCQHFLGHKGWTSL